jgi:hypothetical protein
MKVRKRLSVAMYAATAAMLGSHAAAQGVEEALAPRWRELSAQLELRAGAAYTDNAARSDEGQTDDVIATAGVGIDFIRDGVRLDATAIGDLDWVEYLDDTFDGAPNGYFDGSAIFNIIGESLQWNVRETYGQLISDPLRSDTLDNLEDINYFSTGPRANLRLGAANRLSIYATFSRADYEKLNSDNDQLLGGVQLARILSEASEVGLNVSANRVEYEDSTVNPDYDIQSAYLNYSVQGFRTGLDAALGYSRVVQDDKDSDGMLARLDLTRRMSASSSFFLRGRQQFSNSGNLFREGLAGTNPTSADLGVSSGDVFKETGLGVGIAFSRTRTRFGIGVDWSEEEHEQEQETNREVFAVEGYFVRNLRTTLTLSLEARFNSEEYGSLGFEDERLEFGASLGWQLGRNFAVDFQYDYSQRTASEDTSEYDENRFGIRLVYQPFGSRTL